MKRTGNRHIVSITGPVMVEARGVEPLSENRSAGLSTSVSGLLISSAVAKPAKLSQSSSFIRGRYKSNLRLTFTAE